MSGREIVELQEPTYVKEPESNKTSYTLSKRKQRPTLNLVESIVRPVYRATFVVGDTNQKFNGYKGYFGGLIWLINIIIHYTYDIYQSFVGFGHVWTTVSAIHLITICVGTIYIGRKVTPWLENALNKLEKEGKSKKTLEKVKQATSKLPWIVLLLSVVSSSLQFTFYKLDDTLENMTMNYTQVPEKVNTLLVVLRFTSLFHVSFAYGLFWGVPVCIMIMTGHAFKEYQDFMFAKLKDKEEVIPFKEAVLSYSERVNFLEHSYKSCSAILGILLFSSLGSFTMNAYNFMYHKRKLTFIWLAMMPLLYAIYPLCVGAWITKQYRGYVVTVVKAWADRPESEDEDEDGDEDQDKHQERQEQPSKPTLSPKSSFLSARIGFKRPQGEEQSPEDNEVKSTVDVKVANGTSVNHKSPNGKENKGATISPGKERMKHLRTIFKGATKAVGKMQTVRNRPRFNFDKYIAYLQNVVPGIGFRVVGISITWNRITTILFLEFSILALFVQETIFGNQQSTIQ